jgi:membrane protease YdiL (CAAX protease family)
MAGFEQARARAPLFEPSAGSASPTPSHSRLVTWSLGAAVGSFLLAFAIYVVGSTILEVAGKGLVERDKVIASIVAYQFLALGVAASVRWLIMQRAGAGLDALGFRFPGVLVLARAVLMLVPIFVGVSLISAVFSMFLPGFHLQGNARQELPVGNHVNAARAVLVVVWAAVEAPLVEETLFRGIIFQGIARFSSRWLNQHLSIFVGALISGVIFGLAHFEPHTLPILVFLGVALAYIFYYSRSIYASMLVHGTVNAIAAISVLHGS